MEQYENRPYNSVGSSRIRGRWLLNYWPEAEEFVMGKEYDVVIYQKAYWQRHMENFDGIKIFDLCDKDWPKQPIVEVMSNIDAVVCSTEPLSEALRNFNTNIGIEVKTIKDRVDLNKVNRTKFDYGQGRIKNAVWYGYFHNFEKVMSPVFWDLRKKNINLTVISDKHPIRMRGFDLEIESKPYNQETIYENLAEADVVLNPKRLDGKWKYKSENKTVIAWACGVPVARTLDELEYLDRSASDREAEARKRLNDVKENYDVRISVDEYKDLIKKLSV